MATGDGGDGSPVETDPLGNNVGTHTPYIEVPTVPYTPDQQYPMLQSYFDDAPMYITECLHGNIFFETNQLRRYRLSHAFQFDICP